MPYYALLCYAMPTLITFGSQDLTFLIVFGKDISCFVYIHKKNYRFHGVVSVLFMVFISGILHYLMSIVFLH